MDKNTHIYDRLRELLGGKLPVTQFNAAKSLIDNEGSRAAFRIALGLSPDQDNDQKTSISGQKFIQGYEKKKLTAYMPTPNDRPTIGWGTTFYPDGSPVKMGDKITDSQADAYFAHDLKRFEDYINETVSRELTQNQFDALVSLVYNIGGTAFRKGSIDDKLNAGDIDGALKTWALYNKQAGVVLKGLTARRNAEIEMFKR